MNLTTPATTLPSGTVFSTTTGLPPVNNLATDDLDTACVGLLGMISVSACAASGCPFCIGLGRFGDVR